MSQDLLIKNTIEIDLVFFVGFFAINVSEKCLAEIPEKFSLLIEKKRDLHAQRKSGSIYVYYRLQQETFENLFIPRNKLLPRCVSVC